jgi:pimeloyl-ACP methyl ester carboxylesterase
MQTTNVDEYQAAAIKFVELAHPSLPYTFYLACLGNSMVQRREVTVRLLSRTQSTDGLLTAGRESDLPLFVVHGSKDKIIVRNETLNAVQGWKNMKMVVIDDAEHFIWISQPEIFRREVLGWIAGLVAPA